MQTHSSISFYGGAGTVTGSNFVFSTRGKQVVIDCGLLQGQKFCEDTNHTPFAYDPNTIDAVVITHGHLDHVGRLPKLVKDGFTGAIYSTVPTKELAALLFEDGIRIMEREAEESGGQKPMYNRYDAKKALSLWKTVAYHAPVSLGPISFVLKDAGHILGSAMIDFDVDGKHVVFTGDIGNSPAPLLRDAEALTGASYIVTESVYGDRIHESTEHRREKLEDLVEQVIRAKGTLLIPAFSIERTQTLLSELNSLVERGKIPAIPVFLDSPLAIEVTELYKKHESFFNKRTQNIIKTGDDIFAFPNLIFTETVEKSKGINEVPPPKIIIAGSGMSTGGRIVHHERQYLGDANNMIIFVGHQAAGSLGRQILDGASEVEILGKKVLVNAHVNTLFGYSAHKDTDGLLEMIETAHDTVQQVFVAMGEPTASFFLAQRCKDYLGIDAIVPEEGQTFTLEL